MKLFFFALTAGLFFLTSCSKEETAKTEKNPPNIILIITDDQGYGDVASHGNTVIQTPALDKLHAESIRFTDFHVNPTCAPTRASIMTGLNKNRAGIWHTIAGRSIMRKDKPTLPEILKENGYKTALFGKWHLGDHYPFRPQDRGFDEVLMHGGGGITQTPDYWGNDYFDDTYFRNGQPEKFEGYCTDVWFNEAQKFMEANKQHPFFCYISTNAPHGPFHVSDAYRNKYLDENGEPKEGVPNPNFYGMITNIDDNLAKLENYLKESGQHENTILIFMTDNGTSSGVQQDRQGFKDGVGFNAGMRGKKGSAYEGGHRVPFFIRWPKGGLQGGKDVKELSAAIDIMPTLLDLLEIQSDKLGHVDGTSLLPFIKGDTTKAKRVVITDTQRNQYLEKWRNAAIMHKSWRLVFGEELYDIAKDPEQRNDVAEAFPEMKAKLRAAYEAYWDTVSQDQSYERMIVGHPEHNPVELNCHDIRVEDNGYPAWNQYLIRQNKVAAGSWALHAHSAGKYRITATRWPSESGLRLNDTAPVGEDIPNGRAYPASEQQAIASAKIMIGDQVYEQAAPPKSENPLGIAFEIDLPQGDFDLYASLIDDKGQELGTYYLLVERI